MNLKQAPKPAWSPTWDSIPGPWDHDVGRNQESDAQTNEALRHPRLISFDEMFTFPFFSFHKSLVTLVLYISIICWKFMRKRMTLSVE